jgi:glycosyltransferase involved in cell wall biosynthesis
MKILVVVPYFDEPHRWMISGQKTAYTLALDHDVVVLTTGVKNSIEQPNDRLKIYRLKDIFLRDPINYSIIPGLFSDIKKIVQEEKPDAFLINKHMFYSSLVIWPLKKMGKRVVVQTDTFPGVNWFPKNKLVGVIMWIYARFIGNPILRAADKVILLHEGLIEDAIRLGLKYEVIHNGIDLAVFDATPRPPDLKKKKDDIWIGYVGRLESVKGWYDLAAVAKELVPTNERLHFFFVGPTKNAEEKIKEFRHPRIHFLGLRKDVAGIDKMLDIFVMPSLSEGLSNAIMEAMAAECCCLVSAVGGNKVLIDENVTGRLFTQGDQGDLKEKLSMLLSDRDHMRKLGRQARDRIEKSYDLHKNAKQIAKLLK